MFYHSATEGRIDFAMRCQHVAEAVDVGVKPPNLKNYFRFYLHLSLCQACKNYFDVSRTLRRAVLQMVRKNHRPAEIERLNKELLAKYSRTD
jgi:hypothetical protein